MKEDKDISHVLHQARPSLSEGEKDTVWSAVEANISLLQPVLSSYSFTTIFKQTYIMAPLALLLAVVLGGGATAYASDAAKPGDLLYPVDRLVENVQLGLAFSPEAKELLVQELTEERLGELREIVDEEVSVSPSNAQEVSEVTNGMTLEDVEIDATVFTDTTVVKLELGGKKFYFETGAQTRQEIVDEIIEQFPILNELLTSSSADTFLQIEVANRESRPNDRGIVSISPEGEERIGVAVHALIEFLDTTEIDEDFKDVAISSFAQEVEGAIGAVEAVRKEDSLRISDKNGRVVITLDDEGNSMVEVRSEHVRVKVEDHDGEVKVEKEKDDKKSMLTSMDVAVDAMVYTDITVVTISFGTDEFVVTTSATTTEAIVALVQSKFPALTAQEIQTVLAITSVDQVSTPFDRGEDTVIDMDTDGYYSEDEDEDDDSYEEDEDDEYKEYDVEGYEYDENEYKEHNAEKYEDDDEHDFIKEEKKEKYKSRDKRDDDDEHEREDKEHEPEEDEDHEDHEDDD